MKLEARFTSRDNSLFKLDGTEVPVSNADVVPCAECVPDSAPSEGGPFFVKVPWTQVGLDEEHYNEEFLAIFRDWLKVLEERSLYAVVVPEADSDTSTQAKKEDLTASMKHCARRIKDCASVIGFAIPDETDPAFFKEELGAKHAQYIFFSKNPAVLSDGSVVRY